MADEILDFKDVAAAIGLPDELPALRLPPRAELANAARAAELPAAPSGTDGDVLETWRAAFVSALSGEFNVTGGTASEVAEDLNLDGQGIGMAITLFLARKDGLALADISEAMIAAAIAETEPDKAEHARQALLDGDGDPARLITGLLAGLRAVYPPAPDDAVVRLTPLGLWAVREELTSIGIEIAVLPASVADMTAEQLLLTADEGDQAGFESDAEAWVAQREPEQAAGEVLRAAAGADSRLLAVSIVSRLGTAAEPAWRDNLDSPELSAYARIALAGLAQAAGQAVPSELEPSSLDLAWVSADMLVLVCDRDNPDAGAIAEGVSGSVPEGEESALFEMIARTSHPNAVGVLAHIGKYHPDPRIAREARAAAQRARRDAPLT